jgi:hypothetical protein
MGCVEELVEIQRLSNERARRAAGIFTTGVPIDLARGLSARVMVNTSALLWRNDDEIDVGLTITTYDL